LSQEFDLNLLRVLVAIHEEQSITLASKRLALSQPTISGALARLRLALDDDLFVKTSHRMEPTARAKALYPAVRDVLARVERNILIRSGFDPATFSGKVTFACSEIAENFLLSPVIDRLFEVAPLIQIHSVQVSAEEIAEKMESGDLDLAIGHFPDLTQANLFQQKLFSTDSVCVMRADRAIAGDRLSSREFARLPHLPITTPSRASNVVRDYFRKNRIKPISSVSVVHPLTAIQIVERHDVTITLVRALGEYLAKTNPSLKIVKVPADFPILPISQYWHRKVHADPLNRWLRGLVKQVLISPPSFDQPYRRKRARHSP
jgi:DNA-binding transcriptional LysR family regulator